MLTIGKVAALADVTADTLRYYEREGLLVPKSKSPGGYRLYDEQAVRRVGFIKRAQACGFALSEIRELLTMRAHNSGCCADVRARAIERRLALAAKIRALQTMSAALDGLIGKCAGQDAPLDECEILATLESALQDGPRP